MIINSISIETLLAKLNIGNASADKSAQGGSNGDFFSLLTSNNEGSNQSNELLPAQILQKLDNKEVSEQLKAILVDGGKVSIEGNNKKDILTALLALSTRLKKDSPALNNEAENVDIPKIIENVDIPQITESVDIPQITESVDIQKILDSLNVEDVLVDKTELENSVVSMLDKLDEMVNSLLKKAEEAGIQNLPELKEVLNSVVDTLKSECKDILETSDDLIVIDPENIKLLIPQELLEKFEANNNNIDIPLETNNQQVLPETTAEGTSDDAGSIEKLSSTTQEVLEKVLKQILTELSQQENPQKQKIKLDMTEQDQQNLSQIELNLLEKVQILQTLAPTTNNNVQVFVSSDPETLKQFDQKLTESLKALSNILEKQLSETQGQNIDIPALKTQLQAKLSETLKDLNTLCKEKQIAINLPKLVNEVSVELQQTEMTIDKIIPGQPKEKTARLDRQINLNTILSGKKIEQEDSISPTTKDISTIDQFLQKVQSQKNQTTQPTTVKESTSENLFNVMAGKHNDPALAGVRVHGTNTFAANMPTNIPTPANTTQANDVTNQVIEKIRDGFNKSQIEMTLNPRHLGKVNVSVALQKGTLIANIVAETAKAAESLKTGIDSLRQTLAEAGYNVEKVAISMVDQTNQTNNHNNPGNSQANKEQTQQHAGHDNPQKNTKQGPEFSLDMGSHKGKNQQAQNLQNNQHTNSTTTETSTTSETSKSSHEENYINTEKGMVNYRV